MGYLAALAALLKKNVRLTYRDYTSLAIQVLATFCAILILFFSQLSFDNDNSFAPELRADPRPAVEALPTIPRCIALEFDDCHTIAYVPLNNARVEGYMKKVAADAGIPDSEVQGYASSSALNAELLARPNRTQAAYIFEESNLAALDDGDVSFIIQLNSTAQKVFPLAVSQYHELTVGPAMLHSLNRVIMEDLSSVPLDVTYGVSVFPHPNLPGVSDAFFEYGPLLLYGVFFISFVLFLFKIVDEKERGMRDYMKLSGLQQAQHYISWGVPFLLSFLLTTLLIILFGIIFRFKFFTKVSFPVYFFTFFLFGFALTGWVFLFEVITRRTQQVAIFAFNFFIFTYLLASAGGIVYLTDEDGKQAIAGKAVPVLRKVFACIPPVMFTKAVTDIAQRAATGFGMSFKEAATYSDVYPVRDCWRWMVGSGVVALLVAMYFDNVVSTPNGVGLSPFYLLSPRYWGVGQGKQPLAARGLGEDAEDDSSSDEDPSALANAPSTSATYDGTAEDPEVTREREAITSGARDHRPLVIKNIVKRYGKFAAVDGFSLSVPRNSVTALLGPNGCGKSTTLKMLSCSIALTSGDVLMYGRSVRTDKTAIRKTLGLCPQQDIYYPLLTAAEHIDLFGALKGMDSAGRAAEVDRRLEEVGLTGAADRYAGSFSGGMQRRLSVCLALTGDPAIVMLDECTTGTDPVSRRDLWKIIEKAKRNRVVLLVTHSMEEAEALSDQIAIMGGGKLRVLGTSLHLKERFGAGYGVTVSTRSPAAAERILQVLAAQGAGTRIEKLAGAENGRPDAVIAEYGLPRHMTDAQMTDVVKQLEQRKDELGVARFSVNHTTLDAVFKRIASLSKEKNEDEEVKKGCCCGG